jgi:Uma2 family endonuclease
VVEVAETSIEYDLEVKLPLYARYGILEVWLVDLAQETIESYREPGTQGYGLLRTSRRGESLAPRALPDLSLPVGAILGSDIHMSP